MDKATWLEDCRLWCQQVKYVGESLMWAQKPSRSTWLEATSQVLDENRATIPHLFFKGEYQPGRMGERITYGLMYREGKEKRRVFMLEVWPAHERSHTENGIVIFGPHIHLGDERLRQITKKVRISIGPATECRWVERFVRHARIMAHENRMIVPPFAEDLFG